MVVKNANTTNAIHEDSRAAAVLCVDGVRRVAADGFSSSEPTSAPALALDAPKGRMASTPASDAPMPGDRVYDTRDEPHRWNDPDAMVAEIEKHIRESHGLEPDKALLREVVAFIRDTFGSSASRRT